MTTMIDDNKPAALSAFLSPASRILPSTESNQMIATKTASSPVNKLSPEQISLKIASMLKPGPPFYSTVSSADLIDNLGSASIMRCDDLQPSLRSDRLYTAKDWLKDLTSKEQESATASADVWTGVGTVWSALNGLPSGANAFEIPVTHAEDAVESKAAVKTSDDDGLWSGIMFACDLDGSNVELTKSCVVPTKVLTDANYFKGNYNALFTTIGAGKAYKWDDWSTTSTPPSQGGIASMLTLYTMPTVEMWSWPSWVPYLGNKDEPGSIKPPPPTVTPPKQGGGGLKRVWVPSTTKVSVHATWWGYTIYLPRAVLAGLEADVDQAEKIALIVHTVLTTILDTASSLPIPAALQAAVLLLKAIAPSTSYIATFIGWSWDQIKSFDKGQGVELTATWLLPIALIPHTWDAAIAPSDTNGDGTPDGPPQKPNVQPVPDDGQTKEEVESPEASQPAASIPDEAEQPSSSTPVEQEPVVVASELEQVAAITKNAGEGEEAEKNPALEHEAEAKTTEEQSEVISQDDQAGEEAETIDEIPEGAKPAQSLLTLAPVAVDGVSLSEEAMQEFTRVPEPMVATQTDTIAEEDEEQEEEVTAILEEEIATGEENKEGEEGIKDAGEDDKGVEIVAEEAGLDADQEEIANLDTTEPNSPDDSVGTPNEGDALGRGKADLPAIGDETPVTPAPANDGVEWQNDTPVQTSDDSENAIPATTTKSFQSTKKQQFKGGARKLFGKMTNKV